MDGCLYSAIIMFGCGILSAVLLAWDDILHRIDEYRRRRKE